MVVKVLRINSYLYKFLNENKTIKLIHCITGKDKIDNSLNFKNYSQFDFIENMSEYYGKINLQISRSGGEL